MCQKQLQTKATTSSLWATNDIVRYSMDLDSVNFYLKYNSFDNGHRNGIQLKKQFFQKNYIVGKTQC